MKDTAFIQWRPSYSVGHPLLDRQHRFVIEVINDLYLALRSGEGTEHSRLLGQRLQQYTKAHLGFEEKLLKQCGYPDLDNHVALHRGLRMRTLEIGQLNDGMDMDSVKELFDFLKNWWLSHILDEDMKYRSYLSSPED